MSNRLQFQYHRPLGSEKKEGDRLESDREKGKEEKRRALRGENSRKNLKEFETGGTACVLEKALHGLQC